MNDELPLIILEGLEGNAPTQLHGVQLYLAQYADTLVFAWWIVYALTGATVIAIAIKRFLKKR